MCAPLLSRELALRVALACRVLPDVQPRTLVPLLIEMVGLPLTKTRLAKVTVTGLKEALAGEVDQDAPQADYNATSARSLPSLEALKEAVRFLWGFDDEADAELPALAPSAEAAVDGTVRVAVATTSGKLLDAHFGACQRFYIYQVSPDDIRLIDYRSTAGAIDAVDGTAFRAELLQDCHILYVQSIGGPAAAKVIHAGIYPLKIADEPTVESLLGDLQAKMCNNPPPWLAKVMNVPVEDRIRFQHEVEV